MADGADGADAFSGLAAYARAWRVKRKMASAASAASGARYLKDDSAGRMPALPEKKVIPPNPDWPTHALTKPVLTLMGHVDVEASIDFYKQHGGYCDCEVMLNVVKKFG